MQSIHYVMLVLALIALFGGFYITHRLKGLIRAAVVRLMPIKHRISDESFNLQTRFSTLTAFLIGLLLTGLFYWGLNSLVRKAWPAALSRQEVTRITPSEDPVDPFALVAPPPPQAPEPAAEAAPPPVLPAPQQSIREYDAESPVIVHTPAPEAPYYIQLYAFTEADRALTQQSLFRRRLRVEVHIIKLNGTVGPYKVLLGPFPSRREAGGYLRDSGLHGILVKAERFQ